MRCIICQAGKRLNAGSLCRKCQRVVSGGRSSLKTDRFWVVMVGVPLVLMAALGTVLVVFAAAK